MNQPIDGMTYEGPQSFEMTVTDEDTGAKMKVEIYNPQFGAECVKVRFGNHFTITMTYSDAMELSRHLHNTGEQGLVFEHMMSEAKK